MVQRSDLLVHHAEPAQPVRLVAAGPQARVPLPEPPDLAFGAPRLERGRDRGLAPCIQLATLAVEAGPQPRGPLARDRAQEPVRGSREDLDALREDPSEARREGKEGGST